MKAADFHFEFPKELIAVEALRTRSEARLLVCDRSQASVQHSNFSRLPGFLQSGDVLIVNESTILPARFLAKRKTGGTLEGLYLQATTERGVQVWLKGRADEGELIELFGNGEWVKVLARNEKEAELEIEASAFRSYLKQFGRIPVPPYIRSERLERGLPAETQCDTEDYQTVFAKLDRAASKEKDRMESFSVASPTASLHFDEALMESLEARGVRVLRINLCVGLGTFAPLPLHEELDECVLHEEAVEIDSKTWLEILDAKRKGHRMVAVGTTVLRAVEAAHRREQEGLPSQQFRTNLFVKPPFQFGIVDSLITNFHWPESSLLILIATFLEAKDGYCSTRLEHRWRSIYQQAVAEKYRLFSYGDGMLIV